MKTITARSIEAMQMSTEGKYIVQKYVEMLNRTFGDINNFNVKYGRRYARILAGSTIHTFVDMETGDILKAATYKSPAPNGIRGSILSEDRGKSVVNEYGANYLK